MREELFVQRRQKFAELMQEGVAVIAAASQKIRSNDTEHPYRQNSDFYYLCGFEEDNALLCVVKEKDKSKTVLFVQGKEEKMELWTGVRLGVETAEQYFQLDEVHNIDELDIKMREILKEHNTLFLELFCEDERYRRIKQIAAELRYSRGVKRSPRTFKDVSLLTQQMRLIKDEHEIALIKKAVSITTDAHHRAIRECQTGMMEYALQAEYEYCFRKNGAHGNAYMTIIAGGNSANTLHYIKNDQQLKDGDLVLIDAGCEFQMYASDITRTFPVSGKFTLPQKELYDMVLDVQLKVIAVIAPGMTKNRLQTFAEELLCEGMLRLGILHGEKTKLIEDKAHKKYFPHGIGHWMGLDVHDPLPYVDEEGEEIVFQPGMILTVEPGIYIRKDDENVPIKYRGIGIRIEDNILVTADGNENLSAGIAKTVEEIESMCASKT
ncbi:MAG: xaa-pro aminopeptidase [Epsilonproteobacteria bacterium]|nr:MAG: xaa-pro aminopeptidase [Campylobacterota bacterium]